MLRKSLFKIYLIATLSLFGLVTATTAQTPCPDALGFSPPLRDGKWVVTQSFASYLSTYGGQTYNGYHSGEDWDLSGGNSVGKPVYAIGAGKVVKVVSLEKYGLGHLIAIEHTGSFTIPGKSETVNGQSYAYNTERVTKIYSVYLHITPQSGMTQGQCVDNKDPIGTIANIAHPHLHFEIRHPNQIPSGDWSLVGNSSNWQKYPGTNAYNGYYINLQSMVDAGVRHPSEFIAANGEHNRTADQVENGIRTETRLPSPVLVKTIGQSIKQATPVAFPEEPLKRLGYGDIYQVQFSPDGKIIAAVTPFGVGLFKADNLEELAFWESRIDSVTSIAFSPNGNLLASAGRRKSRYLWQFCCIQSQWEAACLGFVL
jgi:murein DD-endopeptidase MepM/ murein hydrolase activator NlpD